MDTSEIIIKRSKRRTRDIGFMFSCRLNGIINSQIARGVMQTRYGELPQQEEYSSEVYMRTTFFTEMAEQIADKDNFLLGIAFAQYYVNGYGNVLYPPTFLFSKEVKDVTRTYLQRAADHVLGLQILHAPYRGIPLLSSVVKIIQQERTEGLEEILSSAILVRQREKEQKQKNNNGQDTENKQKIPYSVGGKLYTTPKQAVIAGVSLVERMNPLQNACIRQKLMNRDASAEKVAIALDASKHFSYPEAFIAGIEKAQQIAVVSDTIGITLVEYLTPRLRHNTAFQQFLEEAKDHYNEKLGEK